MKPLHVFGSPFDTRSIDLTPLRANTKPRRVDRVHRHAAIIAWGALASNVLTMAHGSRLTVTGLRRMPRTTKPAISTRPPNSCAARQKK